MTRRFRLKKDLPGFCSGSIFEEFDRLTFMHHKRGSILETKDMHQVSFESTDWFEEIIEEPDTEEPMKKDPWEEGDYEQVSIKDIKVGDIVSYHNYSIFSKVRAIETQISIVHEYDNGKIELQNYYDESTFYRQKTTQEEPKEELWFKLGDKIRKKEWNEEKY